MQVPHPSWVSLSRYELHSIVGACGMPVAKMLVLGAEEATFENPTLHFGFICPNYDEAGGAAVEIPFPLVEMADTVEDEKILALDTVRLALEGICRGCEFRR